MERTTYMSNCMTSTYPMVAVEAIQNGWDNSWVRLIADKLKKDIQSGNSEAEVIVDSVGGDYMKAAKLIIDSKIPESCY